MGEGHAAELEVGEQRLNVADDGAAGGRIAHVADGDGAGEGADDAAAAEIVADEAERLVAVEMLAVVADDAGRFLPPVLQGMEAERRCGRGVAMAPDPEDAALVVKMIVVSLVRDPGRRPVDAPRGKERRLFGIAVPLVRVAPR